MGGGGDAAEVSRIGEKVMKSWEPRTPVGTCIIGVLVMRDRKLEAETRYQG